MTHGEKVAEGAPVEAVKVGHRRQKELVISLSDAAWERRALLWAVALRLLDNLV